LAVFTVNIDIFIKSETAIHYHYDGEGRLIAETDAATGETIRDYVWLGLTPIASFGALMTQTGRLSRH